MVDYSSNYEAIVSDFQNNEIDIGLPGFYNNPNFLRIEQQNKEYLSNYARFIDTSVYTEDYVKRARIEIPAMADVLYRELAKDGRLGACVDISMGLSKMLEREGYWNYIVKGALTIKFPLDSKIESRYFWPIDMTNASAGHVWVVAPPFSVIDISLKQQTYPPNITEYLPDYVITEAFATCTVEVEDILGPEVRLSLKRRGVRPNRMIESINSELLKRTKIFRPRCVVYNGVTLKYITCAISAGDGELEDMRNLRLNNLYSHEIYNRVVMPCLDELRTNQRD